MDSTILDQIEEIRGAGGRSQFIREAIAEHLKSLGIEIPSGKVAAPDRMGKGGRPPNFPKHKPQNLKLNDVNSKLPAHVQGGLDVVSKKVAHPDPKSPPSPSTDAPTAQNKPRRDGTAKRSKPRPGAPKQAPTAHEHE